MRLIFLLFVCCSFAYGEDQSKTDPGCKYVQLINAVFVKPTESASEVPTSSSEPPSNSSPPHANCECVPYSLCKDGAITEDGLGIIDIRYENQCKDLERCCSAGNKITESIIPKPEPHKPGRCGKRNPEGLGFRIAPISIFETRFGEFPWMVALLRMQKNKKTSEEKEIYQCGASLIHPQVVLTSAHCVYDEEDTYKVRAGEWDTQTTYELFPHQDREIDHIIIHPKHIKGGLFYDFALLILDTPLEMIENVDVVCLPNKTMISENVFCYATGWGLEEFSGKGKNKVLLKKVDLPIIDKDSCQEQFRKTHLSSRFKLHDSFICAGGEFHKGTCKGDEGSPLVCPIAGEQDRFYQAAIVSWGIDCGKENVPGVFAHVAKALDWIDEVMTSHNFDTSVYRY